MSFSQYPASDPTKAPNRCQPATNTKRRHLLSTKKWRHLSQLTSTIVPNRKLIHHHSPPNSNRTHTMPNGPNKLADPLVIATRSHMRTLAPRPSQSRSLQQPRNLCRALHTGVQAAPGPALMNLAAFSSTLATLPWYEMPSINSSATFSSSLLRRSLCASLRTISHMASAAAPTSAPVATTENGAAKAIEQRPVQVRAPALFLRCLFGSCG
jgi:hypothetical protein